LLPSVVPRSTFDTLATASRVLGVPDDQRQFSAVILSGKTIDGIVLPSEIARKFDGGSLLVSTWRRRCFCAGRQTIVLVTRSDGKAVFSKGAARNMSPVLIVPDERSMR
jgi:hypothetical protein